jgi:hypothetical protein
LALGLLVTAALVGGCEQPAAIQDSDKAKEKETAMSFELSSAAFKHNERIPKKHTGEGEDKSPPLQWQGAPATAQAFALICDDPDAPAGTWVHWVIWNIPGALGALPEGVARAKEVADLGGARQGANSWPTNNIGYRGPMPPPGHGPHRYHFTLYALNQKLDLAAGATKKDLILAMTGHILGQARLTGKYER